MKNLKLKILFFTLLFLILPFVSHATVSQLVFTTDPQTVAVGAISDKLTVSSGEAPGEISDLTLTSSSATGEFLSESGVAVRPTWNSNWANRTFYYRDSTVGAYTITATLKIRASQQSWSAYQTITVGDGAPASASSSSQASLAIMTQTLRELSAKLAVIKMLRTQKFQIFRPTPIVPVFPTTTTSQIAPVLTVASIPVPKPPGFFTRIKNWFGK